MKYRLYSRVRHIPTKAWTDLLLTRSSEDDTIPVQPQSILDSYMEAAAKLFGFPRAEFEMVEALDMDPAQGQVIALLQPAPTPAPFTRRQVLRDKAALGTLTQAEILEALKEVL